MNNRYLYRAKRTDNGEWVEGFLMDDNYINVPFNDNDIGGRFDEPVEIDPSTICQCTDLPDENVRKIFEGDIVKSDSAIGIVKFGKYKNEFHFGYYIHWINYPSLRPELGFWNNRSSVVGNVFDNSELLEVRNDRK